MKKGLLLVNLGTPASSQVSDVRRFLAEFLADKRVVSLPWPLRYALLYGIILPFRSRRTAHAYQSIWTEKGSPLRVHSENLCKAVQRLLGSEWEVELGMCYGNPGIALALDQLKTCDEITVLPLYPQYASAATGAVLEKVLTYFAKQVSIPSIRTIHDFYQHPRFLEALTAQIKSHTSPDSHIVFSYHGLPEAQLHQVGCKKLCDHDCQEASDVKRAACYRAQCFKTTALLAARLNLASSQYTTAFQSRLGKTPWLRPFTEDTLKTWANHPNPVSVVCPSFVADCLETLEEIGIQGKALCPSLTLIPCLNDNEQWALAIKEMVT